MAAEACTPRSRRRRRIEYTPAMHSKSIFSSCLGKFNRTTMRAIRTRHAVRIVALMMCCFVVSACGESQMSLDEIRALQAGGAFPATVEPLRARIDDGERDPEVLLLYGIALSKTGLHSQALWPLRDAAKDPEWFAPAMLQLAGGAYMTGNHDLAIERIGELLEKDPDNLLALRMRGFARLHTRRDYEGALEDIERILELEPDKKEMLAPRIVALLGLKKVEEARQAIEEFAEEEVVPEGEESPTPVGIRALACVGRAKFQEEDGEIEKAEESYAECAEAFPTQAIAVHEAMEFFSEKGDTEKFDAILRGAYEAAPHDRTFRIALARREQLLGNTDESREILEEASAAGYPGAMLDLAGYLKDSGDLDGAIETYRAARKQGASGPTFLLAFGEALISAGEYDEALEVANDTGPDSHKVFIRGRVALKKKEYDKALELFTQGVLLWPDNAVARYYTALAAEQVGDFDRAIDEYRNAMRIDGSAADSRLRLGRLHLAEENPAAALYILRYQTHGAEPLRGTLDLILLELEAIGFSAQRTQMPPDLASRVSYPGIWGEAVGALARGIRNREGPAASIAMIKAADRLNLKALNATAALRELTRALAEVDQHAEAIEYARAAATANFEHAPSQVILGDALRRAGELEAAEAQYKRALELDPSSASGLMGPRPYRHRGGQIGRGVRLLESNRRG